MSPSLAMLLSLLVPGLGQCLLGQRSKGLSTLAVVGGIIASVLLFHSTGTLLIMSLAYIALAIPSAMDARRVAAGQPEPAVSQTPWYIIGMLLMLGPFAVPLLWQSSRFSRRAKIGWTVAVLLIALLGVLALAAMGPMVDQLQRETHSPFW